jgi:AcrR family transcriptional regulator
MECEEAGRPARGERKRQDIVGAAERLFLENGFGATSMDAIAAEAGASKRTVYNHFPSKDELFRAVLERLYGQSLNNPDGMPAPGGPIEKTLEALAWRVLDHIGNPRVRAMLRLVIGESARSPEIARIYTTSGKDPSIQRIAAFLKGEAEAGRLVIGNPLMAAEQFIGCLKETIVWPRLLGLEPSTSEDIVVREAVLTFLARYAPKGSPS